MRGEFLYRDFEFLPIDRFGDMSRKTGCHARANIVNHSISAQSDPRNRVVTDEVAHQIVAATVGKTEIADQDVKIVFRSSFGFGRDQFPSFPNTTRPSDLVTGAL